MRRQLKWKMTANCVTRGEAYLKIRRDFFLNVQVQQSENCDGVSEHRLLSRVPNSGTASCWKSLGPLDLQIPIQMVSMLGSPAEHVQERVQGLDRTHPPSDHFPLKQH
jgi:hypothetical protein